ncbi:phosphate ABC transporter substrate-binding protein PstS [Demequina sediminicola]|uniref:phosphate ABC transporter substrate-binding protein PstS n=1 Tax=Demequina sediminicola TaxID=1095026 RepID=UPI000781411C|nr:phosphate ABC transporter substrate-binding protein PstS [Demequina sediminicola]
MIKIRAGATAAAATVAVLLAACTPTNEAALEASQVTSDLAGNLQGAGSSAQEAGMDAWRAAFQSNNPDVNVGYDPVGSGGGIEQFLSGAVPFAGSDGLLSDHEYEIAAEQCAGDGGAYHLPMYISPVAVIFNIPGIASLNMDAATIARIFNGDISSWDDPDIAAQNEGVELPAQTITVVPRSDSSGTTENFTDYLEQAAGDAWPYEASKEFPATDAQRVGGDGTSAQIDQIRSSEYSVGYADASRSGGLGTAALKVGDEYVPFSPEAAANIVAASPVMDNANGENDLAYAIDRTTTDSSAYPLTLVSYHIVCAEYENPNERELLTEFEKFVASEEGQDVSAAAAGSAPLTAELSDRIIAILDEIAATE